MQEVDVVNKTILTCIFTLGFLIGSALTVLITELKSRR